MAFVMVVLALAEPRLRLTETRMAVAVLVDTSASVPAEDLAKAARFASEIEKAAGRHWTRVLPFARETRMLDEQEVGKLKSTPGE
ncbi:MAG TPA: hypothetical protein DEH78_09255, partial [Solibacterales bacterium]|nr:hypothetical protein [Bryobacterales bacterium]